MLPGPGSSIPALPSSLSVALSLSLSLSLFLFSSIPLPPTFSLHRGHKNSAAPGSPPVCTSGPRQPTDAHSLSHTHRCTAHETCLELSKFRIFLFSFIFYKESMYLCWSNQSFCLLFKCHLYQIIIITFALVYFYQDLCWGKAILFIKGTVHPKMKNLLSFTHPEVVPNLCDFVFLWNAK